MKDFNFNKYINYCIIGYAFVLPISKAGIVFFELMMILMWFFEANFKYKIQEIKKSKIIIALALFLAFSCISILWSSDKLFALSYLKKYWHFLAIPVIYTSLNSKYVKHIFTGFFLGVLFTEIISYGIFFELFQYKNISSSDPSPFMNRSNFSLFLVMTSVLLINIIIHNKNKLMYILFLLATVSNLFVIGARTGQITFFIVLIIIFILNFKNKFKAITLGLLLSFSILSIAYNFSPNFQKRALQGYQDIQSAIVEKNYNDSFGQRVSLWIIGANIGYDNFLIGTGIGDEDDGMSAYAKEYNLKRYINVQKDGFTDYHSTYVQYFAQLGIIGLFLVVFLIFNLIYLKFKSTVYKNINISFFVTIFIFSTVGVVLHIMVSMTFFAFFVGLLSGISRIEQQVTS